MFRVFYWGMATTAKLLTIGLMYVAALVCAFYGCMSIVFVFQFLRAFSLIVLGNTYWIFVPLFGGLALYFAILGGVVSLFLAGAGKFIAWGFRKDVNRLIGR